MQTIIFLKEKKAADISKSKKKSDSNFSFL